MASENEIADNSQGQTDTGTASSSDPTDQPNRASNIAAVLILLLIFLTPAFGFWWLRDMSREVVEGNSLMHTRDMLVRYMARTRGRWPASWDDLEKDFEPADADYGTRSMADLGQIVSIDFTFDPDSISDEPANPDGPPRVIWLNGRPETDDFREVNAHIIGALHQRRESLRAKRAKH